MTLNRILADFKWEYDNGMVDTIRGWCETYVFNNVTGITADELEDRILSEFFQK
jgi:hypothetical protein